MGNLNWNKVTEELDKVYKYGIKNTKNVFDIDRFNRVEEISEEIKNHKNKDDFENIDSLFFTKIGYETPKLDCRAAVFKENKILLVQELNRLWTMPGGWVDHNLSIRENIIKETMEEAGVDVEPVRVIAVQDRKKHNEPEYIYNIIKVFVLCKLNGGRFQKNIETLKSGYFSIDEIPEMSKDRTTLEQVEMCFKAHYNKDFKVELD